MNPDQRALLNNIIAKPDDDFSRLVYCDWLEENGQDTLAEFIRLQVEFATRRCDAFMYSCHENGELECTCTPHGEWKKIHDRITDLWGLWPKVGIVQRLMWPTVPSGFLTMLHTIRRTDATRSPAVFVRRGFVDRVECTMNDWARYGWVAVTQNPITRVDITDKEPYHASGVYSFEISRDYLGGNGNLYRLPGLLWPRQKEGITAFASVKAAKDWLSDRCIEYTKLQAPVFTQA